MQKLTRVFTPTTRTFAAGNRNRRDGRVLYLRLLIWLSEADDGGLLFHGAERTADGDGGQFPGGVPGDVEIGSERNAVAVAESHFRVVHSVALREHLVPLAGQIRVLFHGRIGVVALSEAGERTGRKQGRRQDQGSFHRAFVLVYDAKVRSRCEPALTRIADMPTRITDSDRPTWA